MFLPKVAIIILNWNGMKDTVECLESLQSLDYPDCKVVLVDNASKNNEGKRIKEQFTFVHLIENLANRGFAGGNNDGMNWAIKNDFEYVVNLNNDCIVDKHWLRNLVIGMQESQADFASSMITYDPERHLICSDGDALFIDGSGIVTRHLDKVLDSDNKAKSIFSACGAGSIYTKNCLLKSRLKGSQFFDELYFAYLEDIDLGIRLNMSGYKGVSVANAVIYHKGSQSAGAGSPTQRFLSEKNRLLNVLLNYPVLLFPIAEVAMVLKTFLIVFINTAWPGKRFRGHDHGSLIENIKIYFKVRIWVIIHLKDIWRDRLERKSLGGVSFKIVRFFYWGWKKVLRFRDIND